MEKRNCVLGIDLGTSSVKILKKYRDGSVEKLKNTYEDCLPKGWWSAIAALLEKVSWEEVTAVGLTSQVGTYLVNDTHIIGWNEDVGKTELSWWKEHFDQEIFVEEISMPHPDIISYPLPRLKYIVENFHDIQRICQPKEYILEKLTGQWVTDEYSWRGLCHLETKKYSPRFLEELGLRESILPPIKSYGEMAGYTKEQTLGRGKIPAGIPVFLGLNDYYSGLLGMGVKSPGQMFDVTGTSEHLGILQKTMTKNSSLVTGPYIKNMVHYGVTASSGPSIKYGLKLEENLPDRFLMNEIVKKKPPIFLPYLKGERAPIWNGAARGVFFGIEEKCTAGEMLYSILEGVVFSLYHIYEAMGKPEVRKITVSGGAAEIAALNQLKADVFKTTIEVVEESDVSALGACMVAAVGLGWFENLEQGMERWIKISAIYQCRKGYEEWFVKRFQLYKELYERLKPLFETWKTI